MVSTIEKILSGVASLMGCIDEQQKMIDSLRRMIDMQNEMITKTGALALANNETIKELVEQVEARWGGG